MKEGAGRPTRNDYATVEGNASSVACALFEDGSVIFTAEGRLQRGNPLSIDTEIGTHRIRFEGSDFLAVRFGDTPEYVFGACTRLEIDGKIYV